jgi:hypothetical protein
MKIKILTLCSLAAVALSCNSKKETKETSVNTDTIAVQKPLSKADSIIALAITTHGGDRYGKADYSFMFREKKYRFKNDGSSYEYSSEMQKGDSLVKDVKLNNEFTRYINSTKQTLSKEEAAKYGESLNSVIYFATLPHKLQDASVHKKYVETTTIKGQAYDVIEVTFGQDGGGKDFDDQYYYWINRTTHKMDYFGYNYQVNDGGVRFRAAYNSRVVGGITFQDYINYEAPVGTPLKDLATLYENDKLKELSKIASENVTQNKSL